MQRIRQHSFAALIGVLAFAAAASAQSPEAYPSARPAKSYRMAFPGETVARGAAPEEASTTLRVSAAIPVEETPAATAPAAGCASGACSNASRSSASQTLANLKARLFNAEYGCVNPVTCGNWRTERTFIFGSCCQFFNPGRDCGTCGQGCGGAGYWSKCPGLIYGPGVGTGMNPCVYDSYLNH